MASLPLSLQSALMPQGLGVHGETTTGSMGLGGSREQIENGSPMKPSGQ